MDETQRRDGTQRWRRFIPGNERRQQPGPPDRRRSRRVPVSVRAGVSSIDPVRDRHTGALYYDVSEREELLEISRRGLRLRMERAPDDGSRLLLRMRPTGHDEIDLVVRTRWSHVEYVRGECGARATTLVGLEIIGGPGASLDAFERWLASSSRPPRAPLARPQALG